MGRGRDLWRLEVKARPKDPAILAERGVWTALVLVAGRMDDCVTFVNEWLADNDMDIDRHGRFENIRRSKGREGPGVVAVEAQNWPLVDENEV